MSFKYEPAAFALTLGGPVFLNGQTPAADEDRKLTGSASTNDEPNSIATAADGGADEPAAADDGVIDLIDIDDDDDPSSGALAAEQDAAAALLGDFVEFTDDVLAPATVQPAQTKPVDLNKHDPDFKPPWVHMFSGIQSPMLRLHNEIVELCKMLEATEEERAIRQQAVDEVSDVVHTIWPGATTEVFGSFATGLYVPTSDIDLVVMDGPGSNVQEALKALANALVRKGLAKNMQVIGKARVPIIKFEGADTGIKFDISFNVPSGPQGAALVKEMLDTWPPMKPLVLMLKVFLQQRELNEVYSGGLGSYSLITLVASFLQLHASRRPRSSDEPRKKKQKTGSGREKKAGELEGNLGVLFLDLLRTYGRIINTQKVGISCKDGGTYFPKHERGDWVNHDRPFLLAVEDPADETNDIGRNSFNIMKVRSAFDWAYQLLVAPCSPHESLLARVLHLKPVIAGRGKPVWKQPYPRVYSKPKDNFRTPTPHSRRGRDPDTAHSARIQRSDPQTDPRSDPRDVRSFLPSRQSIASNATPQITFRTIGSPYPPSAGGFGSPTPMGPPVAPMMWRTPSGATPMANSTYGVSSVVQMQNTVTPMYNTVPPPPAYTPTPTPMQRQQLYSHHQPSYHSDSSFPRSQSAPPSRPVTHSTAGYSSSHQTNSIGRSNSQGGGGRGSQTYNQGGNGHARHDSRNWNNQPGRGSGSQGHNYNNGSNTGRRGDSRKGHSARLNTHIRFDD